MKNTLKVIPGNKRAVEMIAVCTAILALFGTKTRKIPDNVCHVLGCELCHTILGRHLFQQLRHTSITVM